jgi:hypothetical protein
VAVNALTVEGQAFPLAGTGADTVLADETEALSPLVRLVNAAVTGTLGADDGEATIGHGLEERFARSESVIGTDPTGVPVRAQFVPDTALAVPTEAGRRWQSSTGSVVSTNAYLVTAGEEDLLVPRPVLVQLIARLDQLRSGTAAPVVPTPQLPPDDLYAAFGIESSNQPVSLDLDLARYLEEQAVAVDALELDAPVLSRARAAIKRRLLLESLESLGLLTGPDATARAVLDTAGAGRVLGYVAAADGLRAYLGSGARQQAVAEPRSMAVVGGPVSLDWFRLHAPTPPGIEANSWLAHWENVVASGARGGRFGDPPRHYVVAVRDEGGPLPALLRVAEG